MAKDIEWTHELVEQFDFIWREAHLPRLRALTDDQYLWEPAPGCWSVRPGNTVDFTWPPPEPAPVTTIAWRLSHVAVGCFGIRASNHFGDGSLTEDNAPRPLGAAEGVAYLEEQYAHWKQGVSALDAEGLARPVGPAEHHFAEYPMATLVLHIHREAIHHLAEAALLLDLHARQ